MSWAGLKRRNACLHCPHVPPSQTKNELVVDFPTKHEHPLAANSDHKPEDPEVKVLRARLLLNCSES